MRSEEELARTIDATLLRPNATQDEILSHLETAQQHSFKTVAIGCAWIPLASEVLEGSDVGIDAPIGFPNGYSTTESKVFETIDAFAMGATEADMVANIGWLLSGRFADLEDEIRRFVAAASGKITKVILETCYLTDAQKRKGVRIARRAGADFVKTSTGFAAGGATIDDVKLMVQEAGDSLQVKASGGIRTRRFAEQLLDAGATRLGASDAHLLIRRER
jgi:deoxyribose-phosphate aldolase